METDADRLGMIKALGGQLVTIGDSQVWAIFENAQAETLSTPGVDVRTPLLTCRSSDAAGIEKDAPVIVGTESYRVKRTDPDGAGMTTVILKR